MNLLQRIRERVVNDEPVTDFDAEPADLDQLEPDIYDQADIGDEDSK